jgi:hypothetical protein
MLDRNFNHVFEVVTQPLDLRCLRRDGGMKLLYCLKLAHAAPSGGVMMA